MNEMNEAQSLFETISRHLFAQGELSVKPKNPNSVYDRCAYRGENGLKCAVGAVLPDEEYQKVFDEANMPVTSVVYELDHGPTRKLFMGNLDLLANLQAVHDDARNWETSENMTNALIKVGTMFCLKVEFIDQCYFGMTK